MNNDKFIKTTDGNNIKLIENRRGNIPFYTLSQVASLLNEDEQQIRYYTNIFDDILKIDIVDKQFVYTDSTLNKLEFLIKLKNKGMTLKQITDYCNQLPLDETETFTKECNTASIDDFINILIKSQSKDFEKLQEQFSKKIESYIESSLASITNKLIDEQSRQLKKLETSLYDYINTQFNNQNNLLNAEKDNSNLINKCQKIIDEKSEILKEEINNETQVFLKELKDTTNYNNNYIISEIKKIKDLIFKAYYVESAVTKENKQNNTILKKLLNFFV